MSNPKRMLAALLTSVLLIFDAEAAVGDNVHTEEGPGRIFSADTRDLVVSPLVVSAGFYWPNYMAALPSFGHYEGEYRDGLRHGKGVYTWPDGTRYVGDWHDDKRHGKGVRTWEDGEHYKGEYRDGLRHGKGVYTWPDGTRYVGEWSNNHRNGQGIMFYPKGERHEGYWRNGQRHGKGVYTCLDGRRYAGEWRNNHRDSPKVNRLVDRARYEYEGARYEGERCDGKAHGKGVVMLPGGERYEGDFRDGLPNGRGVITLPDEGRYEGEVLDGNAHGRGVITLPDGQYYEGEFRDGELHAHGKGVLTTADGEHYEGEYRDGLRHGRGVYTYKNGDRYVGEFVNNKKHGQGIFIWANGDRYVGEFVNHKRQGRGVITWANGDRYVGEFVNNEMHGRGALYISRKAFREMGLVAPDIRYVGGWRNNKKHGRGIEEQMEQGGSILVAEWTNGYKTNTFEFFPPVYSLRERIHDGIENTIIACMGGTVLGLLSFGGAAVPAIIACGGSALDTIRRHVKAARRGARGSAGFSVIVSTMMKDTTYLHVEIRRTFRDVIDSLITEKFTAIFPDEFLNSLPGSRAGVWIKGDFHRDINFWILLRNHAIDAFLDKTHLVIDSLTRGDLPKSIILMPSGPDYTKANRILCQNAHHLKLEHLSMCP